MAALVGAAIGIVALMLLHVIAVACIVRPAAGAAALAAAMVACFLIGASAPIF